MKGPPSQRAGFISDKTGLFLYESVLQDVVQAGEQGIDIQLLAVNEPLQIHQFL